MLHVCRAFPVHVVLFDQVEGKLSETRDSGQLLLAA